MKKSKWPALLLAGIMAFSTFAACAKDDNDGGFDEDGNYKPSNETTKLQFWGWGDDTEATVFQQITDKFNDTVGAQNNVKVTFVQQDSASYSSNAALSLAGNNPPDIVYVEDKYVKSWADAGYLLQLDTKTGTTYNYKGFDFENSEGKLWNSGVSRYRYNVETTTSNATDPLWALPKDIGPTVLYYNAKYLQQLGITEISVPESELAAYNTTNNTSYRAMGYDAENKVFNNRIAMSWGEVVALAQKMQTLEGCRYGYYNEWWFNYGWSVGGDCVQFVDEGDGNYYKFTLNDETPNYKVKEDQTVTLSGVTYEAGEIVGYSDKSKMTADDKAKCDELPSMKDAFLEFVALTTADGVTVGTRSDGTTQKGYGISMGAKSLGTAEAEGYFADGTFGMFVDGRWEVPDLRKNMSESSKWGKGSWNVAPLPIYKEYDSNGNVTVSGVPAGHSGSMGLAIAAGSSKPNAAWLFLRYVAGEEGQKSQSLAGFAIPNQIALANDATVFLQTDKDPVNSIVYVEAAAYEQPGDWWKLKDATWIDDWANYLNHKVREGENTVDDLFNTYYESTQAKLKAYTKKAN